MTKKGPLGKAEEFYIQHHYKTMEIDESSVNIQLKRLKKFKKTRDNSSVK